MQFKARAKYVRCSPYKLRPVVDCVRKKDVLSALRLLSGCGMKKVIPVVKLIASAVANAKHNKGVDVRDLYVADIRVDEGPRYKYHKPGAMGRSAMLKKRVSHMGVVLKTLEMLKERKG